MIASKLFEALRPACESFRVNRGPGTSCYFMKFDSKDFNKVASTVRALLDEYRRSAEIVYLYIASGEFVDLSVKTLDVVNGFVAEVYEYNSLAHWYIRLYVIRDVDNNEWVSLYIDEDSRSCWWTEEERRERVFEA